MRNRTIVIAVLTATLFVTACDDFTFYQVMQGTVTGPAGGPLVISPISATLPVGGRLGFSASGGQLPYKFLVVSGAGVVDEDTGLYAAPDSPGSDIVRVTDDAGATADAQVTCVE